MHALCQTPRRAQGCAQRPKQSQGNEFSSYKDRLKTHDPATIKGKNPLLLTMVFTTGTPVLPTRTSARRRYYPLLSVGSNNKNNLEQEALKKIS